MVKVLTNKKREKVNLETLAKITKIALLADKNPEAKRFSSLLEKYSKFLQEEYLIFKKKVKSLKKIFPDIEMIFKDPAKGGPYISAGVGRWCGRTGYNGVLLAYYLFKNPKISKKLYTIKDNKLEKELNKICLSKGFVALQKEFFLKGKKHKINLYKEMQ